VTTSPFRFDGICVAAHTPLTADGALDLAGVERQAAHFRENCIGSVFVGGTTGESLSLSLAERLALTDRWADVARDTGIALVVHVGANCLADAADLAAHAARNRAAAISMVAPTYFKPASLDDLVACFATVAAAAPDLPFYAYDIPAFTGLAFPIDAVLARAARAIPNLAGAKYSNPDLGGYLLALELEDGRFDLPWGIDEYLLAALALGGRASVGSTANFAPGVVRRIFAAHAAGDAAAARLEQARLMAVIRIVAARGYMGSAKALMARLGVGVGPARLPSGNPSPPEIDCLIGDLDAIGFFDWNT
jgi:N-acetylneuraminate lyase